LLLLHITQMHHIESAGPMPRVLTSRVKKFDRGGIQHTENSL